MDTRLLPLPISFVLLAFLISSAAAQNFVPGSGARVAEASDDFEDAAWVFNSNLPKSSHENDGQARVPLGGSANGRWFEPQMRGAPDVIKRVETPAGGIPGSKGAMSMRTLFSGVPNRPSQKMQQDDLIASVPSKLGTLSVSRSPSVVVRVFLPPFDQWEKHSGNSFGFRASTRATVSTGSGRQRRVEGKDYWPGMFIWFDSKADPKNKENSARFTIRADQSGQDRAGPAVTQTGWWTLGMSFSPDGQVHYYIKPGVENLTAKDHIVSYNPYGYRCETFSTYFFDILNLDDGQSWSTEWIVDDPALYLGSR